MQKIYKVSFKDGQSVHTGYKPLAEVWAKTKGSVLEEIQLRVEQGALPYAQSEHDKFNVWWSEFMETHDEWPYADREALLFASWMAAQGIDV